MLDDSASSTVRVELPPNETGPVPVRMQHAETHWFGVAPPQLLLAVATGTCVLALVLFATGHWPYGLILLGIGALLLVSFLEAARRRPTSPVTRASANARERARSAWEAYRVRSFAAAELRRLHNGLVVLEQERRAALLNLGAAAHAGESTAEAAVRARLDELDRREADLRAQLESALEEVGERIRKARLPVQETVKVLPTEPSREE